MKMSNLSKDIRYSEFTDYLKSDADYARPRPNFDRAPGGDSAVYRAYHELVRGVETGELNAQEVHEVVALLKGMMSAPGVRAKPPGNFGDFGAPTRDKF